MSGSRITQLTYTACASFVTLLGATSALAWIRFQVSASAKMPALLLTPAPKTR